MLMLFTSLLVIAKNNDRQEWICLRIYYNENASKWKQIIMSSNYMLLTRKDIGVNGYVYIRLLRPTVISKKETKILNYHSL